MISDKQLYQLTSTAAAALTGMAVHTAVEAVWERATRVGEADPEDPARYDFSWGEALAFAVVSGVLVAVARVAAKRATTAGFRRIAGRDPRLLL